jgi:outer membrane protein TolC
MEGTVPRGLTVKSLTVGLLLVGLAMANAAQGQERSTANLGTPQGPGTAQPAPTQLPANPKNQANGKSPPLTEIQESATHKGGDDRGKVLLPPPALEPGEEALPINLPAALQLADVRSLDINIAVQQLQIAAADVLSADVLWLPTLALGSDFTHHDGPSQNNDGSITSASRSTLYSGISPVAYFSLSDAIFAPLATRQVQRAQAANVQSVTNDTLTSVSIAYFDAQEARSDLAAAEDVVRRAAALVKKTESLAPGIVPDVELARVRTAYASSEQLVETARQRWRIASAEVARVLRLKPSVVVEPLEPPQLRLTLVPPTRNPDELIPIALASRPELTFTQAQAEAARYKLQEEQFRPLIPTLLFRGGGTVPPYPMAYGAFGSGQGDTLSHFTGRGDYDVECLWELRNMGLGNLALIRNRRAAYELARSQDYRFRDFVAKEVMDALAELRSAERRSLEAEREVREAEISATKNLEGLGETKRVAGNINILVIRPLEVVAAIQALAAAYFDFFGSHADFNRAQFRLYRALGNPSQFLAGRDGLLGPPLPSAAPGYSPYACPAPCDQPRPQPPCPLQPGCLPPPPRCFLGGPN